MRVQRAKRVGPVGLCCGYLDRLEDQSPDEKALPPRVAGLELLIDFKPCPGHSISEPFLFRVLLQ